MKSDDTGIPDKPMKIPGFEFESVVLNGLFPTFIHAIMRLKPHGLPAQKYKLVFIYLKLLFHSWDNPNHFIPLKTIDRFRRRKTPLRLIHAGIGFIRMISGEWAGTIQFSVFITD